MINSINMSNLLLHNLLSKINLLNHPNHPNNKLNKLYNWKIKSHNHKINSTKKLKLVPKSALPV
jgi:hypothetical protein